jgi:CheY-like chemotaxis protein
LNRDLFFTPKSCGVSRKKPLCSEKQTGQEKEAMAHILIIDDDDQFRTMLRQLIERNGHEVEEASGGKEGIQLYRENPTDLIITDLIMPGKDGIETIQELKKEFPDIKIIAISGGGRLGPQDYLHLAKMLGARRTLTKPIDLPELLKAIDELLE